ncbi:bifunctional nuclease family protein [Amycolatopsis suaedae]|uniref:Bifunctional nuclease family protein n=1 Tax=Amycolatopsis suaedae TaxID=2510978 RepID=A0A4Q7IZ24_9PSEU|nr:bifunctional nuclease family protein [Amycolatopsis suaedae]RZQ60270.1 bifunctional nuclease family protein [Amycolatopsis suaedae]
MVPVNVEGVALVAPWSTSPVMLLRELSGRQRWLPIVIGAPEAEALVTAQAKVNHPRPTTVELIGEVLAVFGHRLARVQVTKLDNGVFHADLVLDKGVRISARPSDAVVLGVRADVPVEVDEGVFDEVGVEFEVLGDDPLGTATPPDAEEQVAEFRELLDHLDPEDFRDRPS